jgi:hypothetical protein
MFERYSVVRRKRRTTLLANVTASMPRPTAIHATLMLAPGCSP